MATQLEVALAAMNGLYDSVQAHGSYQVEFALEVIGEIEDSGRDAAKAICTCYHRHTVEVDDYRLAAWWLAIQLGVLDDVRDELGALLST